MNIQIDLFSLILAGFTTSGAQHFPRLDQQQITDRQTNILLAFAYHVKITLSINVWNTIFINKYFVILFGCTPTGLSYAAIIIKWYISNCLP